METRHTAEQIVAKLLEAEVALAKGQKVPAVVRKLGIAEQTYYRWRKEYGGSAPTPPACFPSREEEVDQPFLQVLLERNDGLT